MTLETILNRLKDILLGGSDESGLLWMILLVAFLFLTFPIVATGIEKIKGDLSNTDSSGNLDDLDSSVLLSTTTVSTSTDSSSCSSDLGGGNCD